MLQEIVHWAGLVGSLVVLAYLLSRRFGAWIGQADVRAALPPGVSAEIGGLPGAPEEAD